MGVKIIPAGRPNQMLGVDDVIAVNNTGGNLTQGQIVLLDCTLDGVANSAIAATTLTLAGTRLKGVVLDPKGVITGVTSRFRVRGQCKAVIGTSNATLGSNLTIKTVAATGGANLETLTSQTITSTPAPYVKGMAQLLEAGGNGTTLLSRVLFDGGNIDGGILQLA